MNKKSTNSNTGWVVAVILTFAVVILLFAFVGEVTKQPVIEEHYYYCVKECVEISGFAEIKQREDSRRHEQEIVGLQMLVGEKELKIAQLEQEIHDLSQLYACGGTTCETQLQDAYDYIERLKHDKSMLLDVIDYYEEYWIRKPAK